MSFRFGGGPAGGPSAEAAISSSGRYVAFASGAPDLVRGDTNNAVDVFTLDRQTGIVIRLGLPGGAPVPPGGRASQPSISANGRIVAYAYEPPPTFSGALAPSIVLAWDRRTGAVEVVSKNTKGGAAGPSRAPSVSSDGRYVAFVSENPAIAGRDGNGLPDVFRYDRTARQAVLVSVAPNGISTPPGTSDDPSISGDGNVVAFVSDAGDSILPEDTGSGRQVYLRDIAKGTTERISGAPGGGTGGAPADGPSQAPAISSNGQLVAFESSASNLVAGDVNNAADVFLRDRPTGVTTLVSITQDGVPATGTSGQAAISADGRIVAFASTAADLVALAGTVVPAAAATGSAEVYARDVVAGQTILVSVAAAGGPGGGRSLAPAIGGDGRFVAFASTSPALVARDTNKVGDVFLRDLPPVPKLTPPVLDLGARTIGTESLPLAAILSNAGWGPLTVRGSTITGSAPTEFRVVADGCATAVLHRAEACTVSVTFVPATEGVRTATLEIAHDFTGSPRTARLRGTASLIRLELDPPVGPPGTVTIATGSGFPPGIEVRLRWSVGISPHLKPIITDAGGRFRVQVLVFHNDRLGRRELVAEGADATAFPPASATMLISQPSVDPQSIFTLRFVDIPLLLLFRG